METVKVIQVKLNQEDLDNFQALANLLKGGNMSELFRSAARRELAEYTSKPIYKKVFNAHKNFLKEENK